MGFGVSLILIAAGAILYWAVNASTPGVELQTIGAILMAVGGIGFLLSLVFWSSSGGWHPASVRETDRRYTDRGL